MKKTSDLAQWWLRVKFVIRMFVAQFLAVERCNILMEIYFTVADMNTPNDYNMFEILCDTFIDKGYSEKDFLHLMYITRLSHFKGQFHYRYFEEVPELLKKTVYLNAIKACIDHHQHNIPLPEYKKFIEKHIGFYVKF